MWADDAPPAADLHTVLPGKADTWPRTHVIVRKVTPSDSTGIKRQVKNAVACGTRGTYRPIKGRREATHKSEGDLGQPLPGA